jgi:hypothetical protein
MILSPHVAFSPGFGVTGTGCADATAGIAAINPTATATMHADSPIRPE